MAKSGILKAGTRALGYDIITLIGSGQFGEVYEVFDNAIGRRSALKLIKVQDPTWHKAVVEAQMQYLCSHNNVVEILTADELSSGSTNYVAIEMEFISEGSLEDRINSGFIGCKEAVHHIKQILFALEHAHHHGIVHRDVKPANIMLATPRTKLSDFGTVINPSTGTKAVNAFYVPHAPPEALNHNQFSPSCDIYAAGVTLLRAINNIKDWSGLLEAMNDWRLTAANGKLVEKIGFAPTVPRALRMIINRACNRDPTKRYQSAAAFRGALEILKFANDWIKISDDEWHSDRSGRQEIISIIAKTNFEVIYRINGRKNNLLCKKCKNEQEAHSYMNDVIYKTTLI